MGRRVCALSLVVAGLFGTATARADGFVVAPYLQAVEQTSAQVLWETRGSAPGTLRWGERALDQIAREVVSTATAHGHVLHTATLRGLTPDTRYGYRVEHSAPQGFVTRPADTGPRHFRILALSDMQHDKKRPDQLRQVVEEGVLRYVHMLGPGPLERELALVLAPGDLLAHGRDYDEWPSVLFRPMRALLARVPMLPALGNHDEDSPHYFRYFTLPEGGDERWWFSDYANVRIVALDTNTAQRVPEQLAWLERVLDDACRAEHLDFVMAQHHHPERSELWPRADTPYAGEIARRLEAFAERCDKPTFALFGHTHAYARGHSPAARHTMVSVASAGGDLDYAGEYEGYDYPEYVVSQDEYGFVLLDVHSGPDARVHVRRISRGNALLGRHNELRDEFTVRRHAASPSAPELSVLDGAPLSPACPVLALSPYRAGDGDPLLATQLQLSGPSCDFGAPERDVLRPVRDVFAGVDSQRHELPGLVALGPLAPARSYCARVRYRNQSLQFGAWSSPRSFATRDEPAGSCSALPVCVPGRFRHNLLINPGAEEGSAGFAGAVESLASGQCRSVPPASGARLFAVGGVCARAKEEARSVQHVSIARLGPLVDGGRAQLRFGGQLRSYDGHDQPALYVVLRDGQGHVLRRSFALSSAADHWRRVEGVLPLPPGVRRVDLVLQGRRARGRDNDSYFDDLLLSVEGPADDRCAAW